MKTEMDACTQIRSAAGDLDPALRLAINRLLAGMVKQHCFRELCRENQVTPDVVNRLIDGLSLQIKANEELIKTQSRTIERLRYQLIELAKECTIRDGRPVLQ